jgi:hypothetical protein
VRTRNSNERLREDFKRRIKTQTDLLSPDTAPVLFWALLASAQVNMRNVHRGWRTLPNISRRSASIVRTRSHNDNIRIGNADQISWTK